MSSDETRQFVLVVEVPVAEFDFDPDIDQVAHYVADLIGMGFDAEYESVTFARPLSEVIAS